jgi:subfamily B ATP-binding cassette protein MsbA
VRNVGALLDPRDKPFLASGSRPVAPLRRGIRFEDVSFCYTASGLAALDGVTIEIPAGRTTALVGPSGAGKSTLIHLVERFHDPTAGSIFADDVPLPELDLAAWRGALALAGQDMHLFNATVRENIGCGRLGATDAEIEAAARNANAHDFIVKLPRGYDSPTGDYGVRLSGGERQRISLARAFLRDPTLLILDEATNALDSLSEQGVQEAIERLCRDRTVIVIAHRIATVQNADHVIVLDAGRVAQQGTPAALLREGGLFARLRALQRMQEPE